MAATQAVAGTLERSVDQLRATVTRIAWRVVPDAVVPACIRIAEMLFSLVFVAAMNGARAPGLLVRFTNWDADYYADIAVHGYPQDIVVRAGELTGDAGTFAFSPLFPALTAAVHAFGLPVRHAQLVVAIGAAIAASIGVHLLAREVIGTRRAGYIACALLGALPMAIALQMGYAESLSIALGAFSLRAAFLRSWCWASALGLLAGLARPSGGVVVLAILVVAWTDRRAITVPWSRVVGATLVGLAGLPIFVAFVWIRTGVVDGWSVVQRVGWRTRFDFGAESLDLIRGKLRFENDLMGALTIATILGYLGLLCVSVWFGRSAPLVAVSLAAIVLTLGSTNFWHSKPRLLLAAFPLVVLAARPLSRLPTRVVSSILVVAVVGSAWWSAYSLTRWPFNI